LGVPAFLTNQVISAHLLGSRPDARPASSQGYSLIGVLREWVCAVPVRTARATIRVRRVAGEHPHHCEADLGAFSEDPGELPLPDREQSDGPEAMRVAIRG
jgi:hypothetical protein